MLKERSLICLLLVLPIIIWLGVRTGGTSNLVGKNQAVQERFWVVKTHSYSRYDAILMGDSRVYRGVSPQAMETILKGYRIFNFGFSSGGLNPEMYAAAEQLIDPTSSRKTIILGISPHSLTADAARNEQFKQEMGRPADYVFTHLYLFPVIKFFDPITPSKAVALLNGVDPAKGQHGTFQEAYDDGWMATWEIPEHPNRSLEGVHTLFVKFQVQPVLVQALLDQTSTWREEGYKVFAYRTPASPEMIALEDEISGFNESAFIRQFAAVGGTWLPLSTTTYHSYDGNHLTKQAAVDYSIDLASVIKAVLDPGLVR